ncbi:MAG TPA: hydrogenase expression/formation protein HypE [Spirochaetota bacterium]|nr:hydrogenase expression/formation protein HypE [Spirochaetota bacterium]
MTRKILSGHGSGGKLMNEMIETLIKGTLGPDSVQLDDSAVLTIGAETIAFTTDTFTITPLFFPGGDIGSLAVNGTVNDLAVMGAEPMYLSCGVIIEEGLDMEVFEKILKSMKAAADRAGVKIVTGDTKVVQKGNADKIFINTSGVGRITGRVQRAPVREGDKILISGCIGDHGIAVMAERNSLTFTKGLQSDCMALNSMIAHVTEAYPGSIRFMRDPTRGGVASVLNEIVKGQPFSAKLYENDCPLREEVKGVCEILGIDPLYAANEGKVVMIVSAEDAEGIRDRMRETPEGKDAAIIGEITGEYPGKAYMETPVGGERILPLLLDEQLPRIC